MEYQKEIETPIEKKKVVFKTMLTGSEREQVDNAQMDFVETKDGQNFTVTDMKKVALAQKHELLKVSLVSIDGDITDPFKRLHKSYDYEWVYSQIEKEQKKIQDQTSKQ